MTEAQRAALRILEATPRERIRTHEQRPFLKQQGYKRNSDEIAALREQLKDMIDRGCTRKQMITECRCTNLTIRKMFGPSARRGGRRGHR